MNALDPVYLHLGVPAVLTIDATDGGPHALTMIDATGGLAVGFQGVDVATIGPSAYVRASELVEKIITLADLEGAALTLSGKSWRIVSHAERPAIGEVQLFLEEA